LSGKVEYNFLDFGKNSFTFEGDVERIRQTTHTVKFGINYRLGGVGSRY